MHLFFILIGQRIVGHDSDILTCDGFKHLQDGCPGIDEDRRAITNKCACCLGNGGLLGVMVNLLFFKGGDTARKRHQLDAAKIADNHIGLLQCVQIPPDGQGRYAAQHAELVYLGCPVVVQIRQDRIAAG